MQFGRWDLGHDGTSYVVVEFQRQVRDGGVHEDLPDVTYYNTPCEALDGLLYHVAKAAWDESRDVPEFLGQMSEIIDMLGKGVRERVKAAERAILDEVYPEHADD